MEAKIVCEEYCQHCWEEFALCMCNNELYEDVEYLEEEQ